jgi:DNA processing protein
MDREELAGWLRLTLTPGVGNETARKLLAAFGLPADVFRQSGAALGQVVSQAQAAALLQEPQELPVLLDATWTWLHADAGGDSQRRIVTLGDTAYPASLLTIDDPPLMLYMRGQLDGTDQPGQQPQAPYAPYLLTDGLANAIAVVGSRNPTPQGAGNARQFAKALSEAGLCVVSGMALGVDAAAHEGALEGLGGQDKRLATIAVVGTGLDRVYPKAHLDLARRIARHGLIISEFPLGTPPLAENFPRRNRLIAGLARGTLVVEAALKSGSLITARLAAEQGKEVFAIPGSIHSTQSRGCHALIKQGAKLVESAADILEELRIDAPQRVADLADDDDEAQEAGADALLQALGFDPVGLDALQARTGLGTASLQAQLTTLELDGEVARLPGGLFQRMG